MKTVQTLILYRSDITEHFCDKLLHEIEYKDFPISNTGIKISHDIVIFIDNDKKTKILKNMYGSTE